MGRPWKVIDPHASRAYTCAVLELADEGTWDKQWLIEQLLGWMSEYDVEQFAKKMLRDEDNECIIREDDVSDEDAEAMLDDFNYVGSKHHY